MTPDTDERALIRAAAKGNKYAQGILYDRYFFYTVKISNQFLKNWDNALDAAQEVFLVVFAKNKIRDFRNEVKLQTWLYAITRNVCFSKYRKDRRRAEECLFEPDTLQPLYFYNTPKDNPEELLIDEERKQKLRHVMQLLPPLYLKAIVSSYFLEHSYHDGAEKLGVSSSYYGLLKSRATKKLGEIMKKHRNRQGVAGYEKMSLG